MIHEVKMFMILWISRLLDDLYYILSHNGNMPYIYTIRIMFSKITSHKFIYILIRHVEARVFQYFVEARGLKYYLAILRLLYIPYYVYG